MLVPAMASSLRYFAYGSNMASAQMAQRCPGATALGPARLPGFALAFDRWSARRGGYVADVLPAPRAETWGVLWAVTAEDLVALDHFEGVAAGAYRRDVVAVWPAGNDGPVDAIAYRVCSPGPPGRPSTAYLALLIEGAREHGLPAAHQQAIAAAAGLGAGPQAG